MREVITVSSHADTEQQRVAQKARASERTKKREANNHGNINQMTQAEAINSAGINKEIEE